MHADLVRNYFRHFISVEIDYVQVMDVLLHLPLNDRLHHFEDFTTTAEGAKQKTVKSCEAFH